MPCRPPQPPPNGFPRRFSRPLSSHRQHRTSRQKLSRVSLGHACTLVLLHVEFAGAQNCVTFQKPVIIFTAAGVATSLTREHDSAVYHNTLTCDPCTKSTKRRTTRTEGGGRVCPRPSGATIQAKLGTRACQIGASGTLGADCPQRKKEFASDVGDGTASRTSNRSASDDLPRQCNQNESRRGSENKKKKRNKKEKKKEEKAVLVQR